MRFNSSLLYPTLKKKMVWLSIHLQLFPFFSPIQIDFSAPPPPKDKDLSVIDCRSAQRILCSVQRSVSAGDRSSYPLEL